MDIAGGCCGWDGDAPKATLRRGLKALGPQVLSGLRYVCSDMWQPYLTVIAKQAGHALHILDRFHIVQHLNKAVDEVRRAESTRLRGKPIAAKLKKMRWKLLRRGSRVRGQARIKLDGLWQSKLATGRAWDLKECFRPFLALQIGLLGRSVSGLLDRAGHAQPARTDEKGGADAPQTRGDSCSTGSRPKGRFPAAPSKVSTTKSEW